MCMLLFALNKENPYEYYIVLRWVVCAVFAYLATQAFKQSKSEWVWILGFVAGLYNPILPVHLTREIWTVINILAVAISIGSVIALSKKGKKKS